MGIAFLPGIKTESLNNMDDTTSAAPNQQARTLIILHGQRYIQVFGSDRHPVKIVNVPDMRSIKGELLIEELFTLKLPPCWARVYSEGYLLDRDIIREVSVADLMARDNNLALIRCMNRISRNEVNLCTV